MSGVEASLACAPCGERMQVRTLEDVCTRCGRSVSESINTAVIDGSTMSLCDDVVCVGCGYNLRTLLLAGGCPECSTPVIASLLPDDLRFAPVEWLRRVRDGVTVLLIVASGIAAVCILSFTGSAFLSPGVFDRLVLGVFFGLAGIVLLVLGGWGVLRATASDPTPRGKRPSNAPRNIVRACVCLSIAYIVLGRLTLGPRFVLESVLLGAAAVASVLCTLIWLRRLSIRGRQPGPRRLTSVLIGLFASLGIIAVAEVPLQIYLSSRIMTVRITSPPPSATTISTPPLPPKDGVNDKGLSSVGYASDSDEASASVFTAGTSPVGPTTVPPVGVSPAVPGPPLAPGVATLLGLSLCGLLVLGVLGVLCCVISLILLAWYRALLSAAIAAASRLG